MIESNLLPKRSGECCECKCSSKDLDPTFLCFRTCASEAKFQRQPDPNFRKYIGASTVIFLLMAGIQICLVPNSHLMALALSTTGRSAQTVFGFVLGTYRERNWMVPKNTIPMSSLSKTYRVCPATIHIL